MHWPLSSRRPFHPPSLLTALHPSISTHVDETEIDEEISDGQPFHSNTPNEFWLPWPTLLCWRLILTQSTFWPWQFCVLKGTILWGQNWVYLTKSDKTVEVHTYKEICYYLYCKIENWHKVKPSSHTSAPLTQIDCSLYVEVSDCLLWRISLYSAYLTSHFNSKWLLNETVALETA